MAVKAKSAVCYSNLQDHVQSMQSRPLEGAVARSQNESDEDDGEAQGYEPAENDDGEGLKEQDRFLPIANIGRIMKNAIPGKNGKIAKEAKECMQECVSEFLSFITSEAGEHCQTEKRKTISGEDILLAMQKLGFDSYVEPLRAYLANYRQAIKMDKGIKRDDDEPKAYSHVRL